MSNQPKINNLDPITKTFQRTDKRDYGTTKYIVKMKDMQRIEERLDYNEAGELREVYIQFSDESSRRESEKNPGEIITYRDEVTFTWHAPRNYSEHSTEPYERTNWSTGWQDDLEGKMKEAEIRNKALKYFVKRRQQLSI